MIIDDFAVIREIGRGGMAIVYEAEQRSLKRRVALKILPPALSLSDEGRIRKFYREAEAGGRQHHPGIVSVYTIGEAQGVHFIAQELVEKGRTLAGEIERLRQDPTPLSNKHALRMATLIAEVADALAHAHDSGVIHRDVKPSNILITPNGNPKISDFGLATIEDSRSLSLSSGLVGTPYYMSPEQILSRRSEIDARTDIYSLGVTLYEALTLVRPLDGESTPQMIKKILFEEPRPAISAAPHLARDLSVICGKAMEKERDRRYACMNDFSADLKRFIAGEPIQAQPPGWVRKIRMRLRRYGWAVFSVFILIIALVTSTTLGPWLGDQREAVGIGYEPSFKPLRETLELRNYTDIGVPYNWLSRLDPQDPAVYFYSALQNLEWVLPDEQAKPGIAAEQLEKGIDQCRQRGEEELIPEAQYLLALAKRRQAEAAGITPGEKSELLSEADSLLGAAARDPSSRIEILVQRTKEEDGFRREIKLNTSHFLIRLFKGIYLFHDLYQGGSRSHFEETIALLTSILEERPRHLIANGVLARTYFFYARSYGLYEYLDDAEKCSARVLEATGGKPYHIIYTTLGQIRLLKGDIEGAREYFLHALRIGDPKEPNIHNNYCGLIRAYTRLGDYESAREFIEDDFANKEVDAHLNAALSEFFLLNGQREEALKFGKKGMAPYITVWDQTRDNFVASPYLACARAYMAQGDISQTLKVLTDLYYNIERSPFDLGQACLLVTTIPKDAREREGLSQHDFIKIRNLMASLAEKAMFNNEHSPICQSAKGAQCFELEEFEEALKHFQKAIDIRNRRWPPDTLAYYYGENARDLYFMALIHLRLGQQETGETGHAAEALRCYQEAERLLAKKRKEGTFIEYWDIIDRVREFAINEIDPPCNEFSGEIEKAEGGQ